MSRDPTRQPVLLQDYRPPPFLAPSVELSFVLEPEATLVTSRQCFERNPAGSGDLVLFGEDQELLGIELDGQPLPAERYRIEGDRLTVLDAPDRVTIETTSRIDPKANTSLMGLYLSNGVFCTQCEPEGFRRITWSQDRPDVMSAYRVRIEADKAAFPALLSNGNLAGAPATWPAAVTGRSGRTRSPSPPICSRWWLAISPASPTRSSPAPAARFSCASTPSKPTSTSATTPWHR